MRGPEFLDKLFLKALLRDGDGAVGVAGVVGAVVGVVADVGGARYQIQIIAREPSTFDTRV